MKSIKFAALALGAAFAAPLAAQSATGDGINVGNQDPNWTVSWTGSQTGSGSAWVVSPAGPWQVNTPETKWISAWQGASTSPSTSYDINNPATALYTYTFATTFTASAGASLIFTMGWDNVFQELILNGTSYVPSSMLVGSTPQDVNTYFGFCRDGDGVFYGSATNTDCYANFKVDGLLEGNNFLKIVLRGDGTTDGLWFNGYVDGTGTPNETVPEPATMTLLATGLAGMAAKSFRRRREEKA